MWIEELCQLETVLEAGIISLTEVNLSAKQFALITIK